MWRVYFFIGIAILRAFSLASAVEIIELLGSGMTRRSTRDGMNYWANQAIDIGQKRNKRWVVFTNRMTKKLQEINFDNYALDEDNISEKLYVKKGWKSNIIGEQQKEQRISPTVLKQSLKNANGEIVLLSNSASLIQSHPRFVDPI